MKEVNRAVIEKYGKELQTFVAIEEMAELTKELSKDMRGEKNRDQIIEELADVYICLDQLKIMHDISLNEIVTMMNKKLERTAERLMHD